MFYVYNEHLKIKTVTLFFHIGANTCVFPYTKLQVLNHRTWDPVVTVTTLKRDTLSYDNYEDNIFVNYSMKLIYNCIAYAHLQGSK